jgi:hypothetical protein
LTDPHYFSISDACLAKRDPVREETDPPRDHQQKWERQQLAKEVFQVNPFMVKLSSCDISLPALKQT